MPLSSGSVRPKAVYLSDNASWVPEVTIHGSKTFVSQA